MKTAGVALLFGLCCMIGFQLGRKKTGRLKTIRSLRSDLQLFSERVGSGCGTLTELQGELNGMLGEILKTYLDMLKEGKGEAYAAECAIEELRGSGTVEAGTRMFLTGLSTASRIDLIRRTQTLVTMLERAEEEAETAAKQARVLQISGVLTGAGLAILLL
ncbi:MAG: hypothetical protein IKZ44_03645 [Clostridia bacterium]|nr:hypothetical protein [Clostridia bacterium]